MGYNSMVYLPCHPLPSFWDGMGCKAWHGYMPCLPMPNKSSICKARDGNPILRKPLARGCLWHGMLAYQRFVSAASRDKQEL